MLLPKELWVSLRDTAYDKGDATIRVVADESHFQSVKMFFANAKKRDGGNTRGMLRYSPNAEKSYIDVTLSLPISHIALLLDNNDEPSEVIVAEVPEKRNHNTIPHERISRSKHGNK